MMIDIDDITFRVYCARMDADSGEGASERVMAQDNDGGVKMRRRSLFYRPTVIETLIQVGLHVRPVPVPPQRVKKTEES